MKEAAIDAAAARWPHSFVAPKGSALPLPRYMAPGPGCWRRLNLPQSGDVESGNTDHLTCWGDGPQCGEGVDEPAMRAIAGKGSGLSATASPLSFVARGACRSAAHSTITRVGSRSARDKTGKVLFVMSKMEKQKFAARVDNIYFLSRIGSSLRWATQGIAPEELSTNIKHLLARLDQLEAISRQLADPDNDPA